MARRPCSVPLSWGDRRDADQARERAALESAELGQLGEQGGGEDRPDTRHAGEQRGGLGKLGVGGNPVPEQAGDLLLLSNQACQCHLRAAAQGRVTRWPSCWRRAVISPVSWRR
jgi:hypothetical protein